MLKRKSIYLGIWPAFIGKSHTNERYLSAGIDWHFRAILTSSAEFSLQLRGGRKPNIHNSQFSSSCCSISTLPHLHLPHSTHHPSQDLCWSQRQKNFIFHFFVSYLIPSLWLFDVSCFFLSPCLVVPNFIGMLAWMRRVTQALIFLTFSQKILLTASWSQTAITQMMIQMMTFFTTMKSSIYQNTISQRLTNWMSFSSDSNDTVTGRRHLAI